MSELNLLKSGKVAFYLRSEQGRRSADNIERQERMLLAYATHKEVNEILSYTDISKSSDEGRQALKRLMRDVRQGKVDTVLVTNANRLARSVYSLVAIKLELDRAGARLIVLQQLPLSAEDQLMNGIQNAFAEHERVVGTDRIKHAPQSGKKYARCPHCGQLRRVNK